MVYGVVWSRQVPWFLSCTCPVDLWQRLVAAERMLGAPPPPHPGGGAGASGGALGAWCVGGRLVHICGGRRLCASGGDVWEPHRMLLRWHQPLNQTAGAVREPCTREHSPKGPGPAAPPLLLAENSS